MGLFTGQLIIIERRNEDGTWPADWRVSPAPASSASAPPASAPPASASAPAPPLSAPQLPECPVGKQDLMSFVGWATICQAGLHMTELTERLRSPCSAVHMMCSGVF